MNVRIWGTRGSYPVARAEMVRYGGNTSCVEIRVGDTCVILDAGSGLRLLSNNLVEMGTDASSHVHMLVTHTHWDHILGFPFFAPLYNPHVRLAIYGLQRTQSSLRTTFDNALSQPFMPFGLSHLAASLDFSEISHDVQFALNQDIHVTTARANHPYRALGYRVESSAGTVVYVSDTGPFDTILLGDTFIDWTGRAPILTPEDRGTLQRMRASMIQLAYGADCLIYDSQFTEAQFALFPHWGHSTPAQALEIARDAHVRELLLFHHDPHRTDTEVDAMLADIRSRAPAGMRVRAAYEGMELTVGTLI